MRLCQIMDVTEGEWPQQQECEEDGPGANNEHENKGEEDAQEHCGTMDDIGESGPLKLLGL